MLFLPLDATRRDAPRRTPAFSFPLCFIPVYPSVAHVLFLFLRLSISFTPIYQTRSSRSLVVPYTRIQVVDIVLRSVSKLRENDRRAVTPYSLPYLCMHVYLDFCLSCYFPFSPLFFSRRHVILMRHVTTRVYTRYDD